MRTYRPRDHFEIWGLALGYFLFYIPYSALTKALSLGVLPGMDGPVPGFTLLPSTLVATSATMLAYLAATGAWRSLDRATLLGWTVPTVAPATLGSGLATAVIIATTTLNYTSTGISILLALLLMRGGVLILSPFVDVIFGRRVHASSWVALTLSFLAIGVAFSEVGGYRMTLPAALIIAAYLAGYLVRIPSMTHAAKSRDATRNRRYFDQEAVVAAVALTALPALFALLGRGEVAGQLREGFTTFFARILVLPALLIGFLYACLYRYGTGIYLDRRENTFCIPLNRCASLMSGLVASYLLMYLLGARPPSVYQLTGAGLILAALVLLAAATLDGYRQAERNLVRRLFLFVCGGNTSRSPMAQAICNEEIARRLGISTDQFSDSPVRALSAGLSVRAGSPLSAPARAALDHLGVRPHEHASREVTPDLVGQAELILCMTEGQRRTLVERFPEAASKTSCLNPDGDIEDPSGQDEDAFRRLAERLQHLVRQRVQALTS